MSFERPYAGIKVVDMSQGVAGPYCGMLLAQHGAEVIKVEPHAGDWSRILGPSHHNHTEFSFGTNMGKRSLAIDLKSAEAPAIIDVLVGEADVFLESFRPGVVDRLGFGHERLMYGSDLPVTHLRGRSLGAGDSFLWLYGDSPVWGEKHMKVEPVLIGLEHLRSVKWACWSEGLSDAQVEDVFWNNAARLFNVS